MAWKLLITVSIAALLLAVGAAADESVNTYGKDFALSEGNSFTIHCNVSKFEALKWQKDGVEISEKEGNNITLLSTKQHWGIQAELHVSYATVSHTGNYRCNSFHLQGRHVFVIGSSSIVTNKPLEGMFKLVLGKPLRFECNVTDENPQITWVRIKPADGKDDEDKEEDVEDFKSKYTVVSNKQASSLTIKKVLLDDAQYDYACKLTKMSNVGTPIAVSETLVTYMPPSTRMVKDIVVVEDEKLVLNCSVLGKPKPIIHWKFGNTTLESDGGRYTVDYNILTIENVTLNDRGDYTCHASILNGAEESTSVAYVRVKDKLSPLWPFLGIVLEVVVLCVIILIYEKRRNKSELDESDTDQSPEQKNTPDGGKEVRHRNK